MRLPDPASRRSRASGSAVALAGLGALALAAAGPVARPPQGPVLPAIVFVSRHAPAGADSGWIPGLGPHGRTLVTGGRLLVRERDGRVRELVPPSRLYDVSDPAVSPDARRVAFAAVERRGAPWRIWIVDLEGRSLERALPDPPQPAASGQRDADDFDPCWVDDTTLCFASTRAGERAQYGGVPASNLYLARLGGAAVRLTYERNGAEEPAMDFARGRIVFARWWHNRWRASDEPPGVTTDPTRAVPAETVSVWHAMEITPAGADERLACGAPGDRTRGRLGAMAYQPALLADGSIAGVYAANPALVPGPGGLGVQRFAPRLGAGRRLAGALVDPSARAGYGAPSGLAPPSACSPAGLPDGRIVLAYDPGGRGDFGLYLMDAGASRAAGSGLERLLDLPGTLELDPAPVVAHGGVKRVTLPAPGRPEGTPTSLAAALASPRRFRYLNLDVFAGGRARRGPPDGPPVTAGARIRFFAALSRPAEEGGDTVALVREAAVGPGGRVDQGGLPAETPMFEQVVGPDGGVLRSAHGPAHVAGLNVGAAGAVVSCRGCHAGHSRMVRGRPPTP